MSECHIRRKVEEEEEKLEKGRKEERKRKRNGQSSVVRPCQGAKRTPDVGQVVAEKEEKKKRQRGPSLAVTFGQWLKAQKHTHTPGPEGRRE